MSRIEPLDNHREAYYDFTGIDSDDKFKKFCQNIGNVDHNIIIKKLERINHLNEQNYRQYHGGFTLTNFYVVRSYIEGMVNIKNYYNIKKELSYETQKYNNELEPILKTIETKKYILGSRGFKNHSLHNMTVESRLKHVRQCAGCNKIADFNILSDDEILNNRILTNDKITKLRHEIHRIELEVNKINDQINNVNKITSDFTKHIMNTYLKHKIFVQDRNKQNNKIIFCVDVGDAIVEVPFTEIIAMAIGVYAKGEFQKRL